MSNGSTLRVQPGLLRGFLVCGAVAVALRFVAAGAEPSHVWDRQGAQHALERARELKTALRASPPPPGTREGDERYLECIRMFQRVYLKDPHFGGSDDALFEAALLYQELGERSRKPEHLRSATRLYRFFVASYPASPHLHAAQQKLESLTSAKPATPDAASRPPAGPARAETEAKGSSLASTPAPAAVREPPPTTPHERTTEESAPAADSSAAATIRSIRYFTTPEYTRVVIDLDSTTHFRKEVLGNPSRLFFDFHSARLAPDLRNKTIAVEDATLKQIRVARNRSEVVRIVLDLTGTHEYSVYELDDPFRILIDIRSSPAVRSLEVKPAVGPVTEVPPPERSTRAVRSPADASSPKADAPVADPKGTASPSSPPKSAWPQPAPVQVSETQGAAGRVASIPPPAVVSKPAIPTSSGSRTMTRMLGLKIGRIVLDPGHGGHDTGTIGKGGLKEKDLVLEVARQLQTLLEQKLRAEVVLTRSDDTFIPLEERTAKANETKADLFVSIHANSSPTRNASGVETYYLNFARTEEAREVAARENAATLRNIRDLENLVKKIAAAEKSAESRELASILQKKLYGGAQRIYPAARNRGVRTAPFVVLIGANMPSVLAEVGFISNPRDERLLRKETNRQQLVHALYAGIEGYMKTLGRDVAQR